MAGDSWADWFSAVSSAAGVGVSVALFWKSREERKEASSIAAGGAALAALPAFRVAQESLTWSLDQLKAGRKPHYIGDEEGRRFGIGWLRSDFTNFEKVLPTLSQLGPASRAAQRAYHHYRELRDDLAGYQHQDIWEGEHPDYSGENWRGTYARLERTESEMRGAVKQIVKLLHR